MGHGLLAGPKRVCLLPLLMVPHKQHTQKTGRHGSLCNWLWVQSMYLNMLCAGLMPA